MFLDARAERQCFLLGGVHVRLRTAEVHSPGQLSPILPFEIRARNWRNLFAPIGFPRHADCDSVRGTPLQQCHRCGCSRVLSGDRSLQDHGCINVLRHGIPCDKQKPAPTEEANGQHRENADQPQLPVRLLARFLILGDVDKCVSQCAPPARDLKDERRGKNRAPCTLVTASQGQTTFPSQFPTSGLPMTPKIVRIRCRAQVKMHPPEGHVVGQKRGEDRAMSVMELFHQLARS